MFNSGHSIDRHHTLQILHTFRGGATDTLWQCDAARTRTRTHGPFSRPQHPQPAVVRSRHTRCGQHAFRNRTRNTRPRLWWWVGREHTTPASHPRWWSWWSGPRGPVRVASHAGGWSADARRMRAVSDAAAEIIRVRAPRRTRCPLLPRAHLLLPVSDATVTNTFTLGTLREVHTQCADCMTSMRRSEAHYFHLTAPHECAEFANSTALSSDPNWCPP